MSCWYICLLILICRAIRFKKTRKNNNFLTETVNKIRFIERKISSLTALKMETLKYKCKVVFKKKRWILNWK